MGGHRRPRPAASAADRKFSDWSRRDRCELRKPGPDSLARAAEIVHRADTILLPDAPDEDPTARATSKSFA